MSKLRKLFRTPGLYFRDFFIKRYPITYGSYHISVEDAVAAHRVESELLHTENTDYDIDIVYTWVDGSDCAWQEKKREYLEKLKNKSEILADGWHTSRFTNHNELLYSVASVKKFLPWVRNIFIVTDGQKPKLKNFEHVTLVDHKDIIDERYLPTFNSHVIEANLYKIEGLSDNFIYVNDDVFAAKHLPKEHFFRSNGLSSIFFSKRSLAEQEKNKKITPTLLASLNSAKLLGRRFAKDPSAIDTPLLHTYIPLNRTLFEECCTCFKEEITAFLPNKFRSTKDINTASFLVPWYMFLRGRAFENVDICYYMNLNSASFKSALYDLEKKIGTKYAPNSFCINDVEMDHKIDNTNIYRTCMNTMFGDTNE